MPITIACPGCAKRYSLGDETAGKTARCKQCGQVFKVPVPPASSPSSSGSRPPVAPPPRASGAVFDDMPGLAPLDDPLPPPAPPRSSTTTRPIPAPPVRPPAPAPAPARQAAARDLPPEPPRRSAAPLDDFGAHEVLDEYPEEHHDSDLPPPPAWAVEKPRKKGTRSGDGPLGALQAMPLPALIFLGGNAALWLFLLAVVVPSMGGGQGGQADANPGRNAQALAAPPGNAPAAAVPAGGTSFPTLPPPIGGLYPAGTNPANVPKPPVREDVVSQYVQALRGVIAVVNNLTNILKTVTDAQSAAAAGPRMQQITQGPPPMQQMAGLPPLTPAEDREVARRLLNEAQAAVQGMQAETRRISAIPGLGLNAAQMNIGISQMSGGLNAMLAAANRPDPGPQPYVEVFVSDIPDGETHGALSEIVGKAADAPGGHLGSWAGSGSAIRVWPVADPRAFVARVFPGPARTEIKGHQIYVSGYQPDPALVAAARAKHAEEEKARQAANAPDPTVPPGTPPIDTALIKLKSGKNNLIQDGCRFLGTAPPVDTRKDEVVKELIPLATSTDGSTAKEAIGALGNWRNDEAEKLLGHVLLATSDGGVREAASKALLNYDTPGSLESLGRFMIETTDGFKAKDVLNALIKKGTPEVFPYLIQYVEKSNDVFGRADAIKALARLKVAEAAPAIVSRIRDNWGEAPDALRAIGPPAESAVIPLLKDPDSQKRKAACEVLRDIGGQDALDTMKKLPNDSDPFVRDEAAKAMQAIAARVKSQKRDDAPAKSKENSFDKKPVKSRG